jgi:hypothetical protein
VQGVHHLPVHVQLDLRGGGVAGPHRAGVLVAGQPAQLQLGQAAFPRRAVHDLQLGRVAGNHAQQPVAPAPGLLAVAGPQQRVQGERGVAQPAVPVVPVAGAAELLGQRGCRRGDDAAGRLVRQRLERDERPHDRITPRPLVAAAPGPVPPPGLGRRDRRHGVRSAAALGELRMPRQNERHPLTRAHGELGDRAEVLPAGLGRGGQADRVGPGEAVQVIAGPLHPRHHPAVVEAEHQVHPHRHPAGNSLDHPDHAGVIGAPRHAVHQPDHALAGAELGLQHQGLAPVAAGHAVGAAGRGDPPEPVLLTAQQRGEAGAGVEPRQAQPVDRPVPARQRGGMPVADHRVVLDRQPARRPHRSGRARACRLHRHHLPHGFMPGLPPGRATRRGRPSPSPPQRGPTSRAGSCGPGRAGRGGAG